MFTMRLPLLFITLLFISFDNKAQVTMIPDPNFEQALIDLGIDSDGEINGSVPTADLQTVTTLDVSGKEISNLTGIQDFTNLVNLNCQNNLLESLNVDANAVLEALDCSFNNLPGITVKNNVKLKILRSGHNKISEINVASNSDLEELVLNDNLIQTINVKNNRQLRTLNCSSNQLSILNIDDNWSLTYLDFSSNNLSLVYLVNNTNIEFLKVSNNPLTTLNLISLPVLKTIHIVDNDLLPLVYFDSNPKLEYISCHDNDLLKVIKTKGADGLKYLNCSNNDLSELDVSENPLLESLFCQQNSISGLDLSLNTKLSFLKCNDNSLEQLDLKNGQNILMTGGLTEYEGDLVYLEGMNALNNENLQCINVDNETDAQSGISPYDSWLKDELVLYSEDCGSVLAVEDFTRDDSVHIYPNPAGESICIQSDMESIDHVVIYSVIGNELKNITSDFGNVPLQELVPGIYFLRIRLQKGIVFKEIIKN